MNIANPPAPRPPSPAPASRAEILAWAMYDWANSAYSTIAITILVSYLQFVVLPGTWGKVVWAWGISASMFAAAILSPVLGALADANQSKRKWLAGTALSGAAAATLLACAPSGWTWLIVAMFVIAALFFELSFGFYNGFLPELADEQSMNRVSSYGFALGYVGGGLALAVALGAMTLCKRWELLATAGQLRLGILIMGLWWGLFTLPAVFILRDRPRPSQPRLPLGRISHHRGMCQDSVPLLASSSVERKPLAKHCLRQAVAHRGENCGPGRAIGRALREVGGTLGNIRHYQALSLFLLGFLLYNDGIQTVISQASTLAIEALAFKPPELILLILTIQFLAFPGAMLVARMADRLGQKPTLMLCLAVWIALVVAAYFVKTKLEFWMLGVILALVMGGTQAISRAIMGMMTPPGRTAEFFGFFNFSGKATSFLGTFAFGLILSLGGSAQHAVLSLLVFFGLGWALVALVNIARGRREALNPTADSTV